MIIILNLRVYVKWLKINIYYYIIKKSAYNKTGLLHLSKLKLMNYNLSKTIFTVDIKLCTN